MIEITSQLVSALLAAQFLGDTMAVRLPSAECYAEQVEKEQRWLPWLAPQGPAPGAHNFHRGGSLSIYATPSTHASQ